MIPLMLARRTRLHRIPAGVKLAALVVAALAVSVLVRDLVLAATLLGLSLVIYLAGGIGIAEWGRQLWRVKWLIIILAVMQGIFLGWQEALIGTARIVSILLLAAAVTLTTAMGEMMAAIEWALTPLRFIGADPARAAFTISLTLAILPVIAGLAAEIREAQRARGVRLGVRWILTLLVGALRHADDVADSLRSRGIA